MKTLLFPRFATSRRLPFVWLLLLVIVPLVSVLADPPENLLDVGGNGTVPPVGENGLPTGWELAYASEGTVYKFTVDAEQSKISGKPYLQFVLDNPEGIGHLQLRRTLPYPGPGKYRLSVNVDCGMVSFGIGISAAASPGTDAEESAKILHSIVVMKAPEGVVLESPYHDGVTFSHFAFPEGMFHDIVLEMAFPDAPINTINVGITFFSNVKNGPGPAFIGPIKLEKIE